MTEHLTHRAETRTPTPSRRALARGAAWAVPTIAVATAAPAFASSMCTIGLSRASTVWASSGYTRTSSTQAAYQVPPPIGTGSPKGVRITINSVFGSNTKAGPQYSTDPKTQLPQTNQQLRVQTVQQGGMSGTLGLHQSPIANSQKTNVRSTANMQTVTFTFSVPVANLRFYIADIDAAIDDFFDNVNIVGAAAAGGVARPQLTATNSNFVFADSTTGDSWSAYDNSNLDGSSNYGNIAVNFGSVAVTSFTVRYYNTMSGYNANIDGDQFIFFGDFAFDYNPC